MPSACPFGILQKIMEQTGLVIKSFLKVSVSFNTAARTGIIFLCDLTTPDLPLWQTCQNLNIYVLALLSVAIELQNL